VRDELENEFQILSERRVMVYRVDTCRCRRPARSSTQQSRPRLQRLALLVALSVPAAAALAQELAWAQAAGAADARDTSQPPGQAPEEPAAEEPAEASDAPGEIIVITGSRVERPLSQSTVATEVIAREEIEASGANDVAELLANHPGLEIVQGLRGSGVRMQGLDPEYVAVLVDGRRAIGRIDGVLDLEGMAVGDIERIEIVKGPSSALYGSDALAGVIHVITRQPERPITSEARAQYGSFGALDLYTAAGTRTGPWRGRVSAGWRQGDGYDLSPESPGTTASAYDEMQISGQGGRSLGGVELSVMGEYLRRDLHGVDMAGPAVFDRDNVVEQAAAALDARWQASETGRLSGALRYSLYRDQFLYDQRDASAGDRYEETNQNLAEVVVQYADRLGGGHDATAGLEGTVESLTGPRIGDDAGERYRLAVFAQDDWRLAQQPLVRLAMGGRLDVDSQFGVHATPNLALRWDPDPRVTARVSYGWGYRAPDFKELYLEFDNPGAGYQIRGNPELEPETSQSVNAGVEVRAHSRVWASVSGYYNDIRDLIDFIDQTPDDDIAGPVFGYGNLASAFTRGLEGHVRVEPLDGLTADLSYALGDTRDRELDRPLPCRPRHQGSVALSYARAGTEGTVRGRLVGVRRLCSSSDGEDTADRYVTLDARVAQQLMARLTLFLGASNLLDQGDDQFLPIAPRTFYGGAQVIY
jgi:outer membrane receptor for ferrienterochelin and colicins